jgi:putative FmdB family regulatory protein
MVGSSDDGRAPARTSEEQEADSPVPLYEYRCTTCGHRFEALRRVGQDATGLFCPECGRSEVEKQPSTFAGTVAGSAGAASCSPSRRFT